MFARVTDKLWIGNANAVGQPALMDLACIDTLINLGDSSANERQDEISFTIHNQELMSNEMPKLIRKLDVISSIISTAPGPVMLYCTDGLEVAPLAAGYYLVRWLGRDPTEVISEMDEIYNSPEQKTKIRALGLSSFRKIIRGATSAQ
jgi:hypothetical protein